MLRGARRVARFLAPGIGVDAWHREVVNLMYLKRISIQGFKSFPDRVDFDFSRGVTCIVGPNGCGKSNVIDAFKWVLGEQSAKLLRGRQMTDMIFNGSSSRRSSGMARVDLYFDNAERTLPLDHDEVCITRKLYRSGESEYLVNSESSRLKDIRDLFLDTGVGADTYSIIEQGRVDNLLSSSSIERRSIFEEAAGVGKYKVRKREAERKLSRTQQNLLRVQDIVEEVEKRLRSVKLQAGKARNYQAYEARLSELRAAYSLAEYHRLNTSIDRQKSDTDDVSDKSTSLRTDIDKNEAEAAKLAETADRLAEELSASEQELTRTRSDIATHEERVDAARRRIDEQTDAVQRIDSRVEQLTTQRTEYDRQLVETQAHAIELQNQTHDNDARIAELAALEKTHERELTEVRALIDDEKQGIVDLVRRSTHLRNEITRLNSHRDGLQAEQSRLGQRNAAIRTELEGVLHKKSDFDARINEIDALIETETQRLAQKSAESDQVEAKRADLTEKLGETKEQRSALRSRLQVLAELERKMEGVGAGVRTLLEQRTARPDDPSLAGIRGMVGGLFDADVEHAVIIEAAIGDRDQHLVLSESTAFLANKRLYDALPGRLTAICLDRLPPLINKHDLTEHPGFVANAVDLVHCQEPYQRLVKHLLGKTVVVETIEHALEMLKVDLTGRRFVTRSGEVVEHDGSVSLGPPSSRAGLIARKSERRDLGIQLEAAEEQIREFEEEINRAAAEGAHLNEVRKNLQDAVYEASNAKVEATAALKSIAETVQRLAQEQPLIAGEVALIERQLAEARSQATESEEAEGKLNLENAERERMVAEYSARIEELSLESDRVRHELTEARVAAGRIATKRASMADAINHLRHGIQTASVAIDSATGERSEGRRRVEESEELVLSATQRLDELSSTAERIEAGVIQLRRRRELTRLESEQVASRTRTLRTELEDTEGRLHQLQIDLQTSIVRCEELTARVKEELSIDLIELYKSYDHDDQDWEEVEAEIAELRQKISRLGNINLNAIAEQVELEERETFLTAQLQDLEDSRKQLDDLIRRLDAESIDRFTAAFETIRSNFRDLFRKLFGGGKADIILENPEDVLESGIEILAKPPGKELQRISLMSGGEKTMTAIALLMSIFRSRPSPLALLDEVDAALDEANNVRYNDIIREFLDHSQFILVTHSKRTMAIGDQLYGITMQEPGVSARVSVKFETDDQSAVA